MDYKNLITYSLFFFALTFFASCAEDEDGSPTPSDLPEFQISALEVEEADENRSYEIEVTLSEVSNTNVVVDIAVIGITAENGVDFQLDAANSLLFRSGETSKTVAFTVLADELPEGKEEFEFLLLNPVNAKLGTGSVIVTILDDDVPDLNWIIPTEGYTTPLAYNGFNLVWADEFEGTEIDSTSWTFEIGDGCPDLCDWGNLEEQYYRKQNAYLREGHLVIEARNELFNEKEYTSARLKTQDKREFQFGRIDVRAAMPGGQGFWPAIWMLGANIDDVSWPACGEIDIMEAQGQNESLVYATAHFGEDESQHQYVTGTYSLPGDDNLQDQFHVFSINWAQNQIQFLVDDVVIHNITPGNMNGQPYPFNNPFYFLLNVAVGGDFVGSPDATSTFPQRMIVDYIRVFQLQ